MLRAPISISRTAYEVLWERADLGTMPLTINLNPPLRSMDNGARMAAAAFDELNAAGLASGIEPHPDLSATLRALAEQARCYYASYISAQHPHGDGPVVAIDGRSAVLAVLDDTALHLRPVPVDQAANALVSALPASRPGSGRSLNFRADELDAEGKPVRPETGDGGIMVAANRQRTDVDSFLNLCGQRRSAIIHLYVSERGKVLGKPVIAYDIEGDGRWVIANRPGPAGIHWITAAPAGAADLVRQLQAIH
jgi:hypothetical protein